MTTIQSANYPCPACGQSREALESECRHCGWFPDRPTGTVDSLYATPADSRWRRIRATWYLMTVFGLSFSMTMTLISFVIVFGPGLPAIVLAAIPGVMLAGIIAWFLNDPATTRRLATISILYPALWVAGINGYLFLTIMRYPHNRGFGIAMYLVALKWFLFFCVVVLVFSLFAAILMTRSPASIGNEQNSLLNE